MNLNFETTTASRAGCRNPPTYGPHQGSASQTPPTSSNPKVLGNFITEWVGYGDELFIKPTGIFVDARDLVHVCDSFAPAVYVFDVDGEPLERWDLEAIYGQRSEPEDIVINPAGTHIYIAEVYGHRVLHLTR